jgi:hypothetical protein
VLIEERRDWRRGGRQHSEIRPIPRKEALPAFGADLSFDAPPIAIENLPHRSDVGASMMNAR